ncbi:hypothetical protein ACF1E9_16690 [Streptomyces roseolus]|uniref:hypothetical protein n=1 Tax=Streptomyces roseolus TaxID=67358 RepID=UPI003703132D
MTTHFTDRDERRWQRHAEERPARPLPLGVWIRALRARRVPRARDRSLARRPSAAPEPQTTG